MNRSIFYLDISFSTTTIPYVLTASSKASSKAALYNRMPRERSRYSDDDDDDHRAKRRKRSDDKKRKHKKQSRRSRSRSYSSRSRSRSRNRSRSRSPKRRISESTNKVTESEKIAERKVEEIVVPQSVPPEPLNVVSAAAQAAARAAEISKLLQSKV